MKNYVFTLLWIVLKTAEILPQGGYIMKKSLLLMLLVLVVLGSSFLSAEGRDVTLPRVSQQASISQKIGLTDITITYSSPGVKKRVIWGELVPYGQIWRAGADENTTISFSSDVTVEGQKLAKGTYGLFTIPNKDEWTIIFSKNYTSWGHYFYKENEDALRVKVKPVEAPFREWLAYDFIDRESNWTTVALLWEKLLVPIKIEVDVPTVVLEGIHKTLRNAAWWNWEGTYNAAKYCLDNNVNLEEALTWIDQSIRVFENYRNNELKSRILDKLGKKTEATQALQQANKIATEAELTSVGYDLAESDIKAAEKVLLDSSTRFKTWSADVALANLYSYAKDKVNALKYYNSALKKAPAEKKERIQNAIKRLQ